MKETLVKKNSKKETKKKQIKSFGNLSDVCIELKLVLAPNKYVRFN